MSTITNRSVLRWGITLSLLFALAYGGLAWYFADLVIHPPRRDLEGARTAMQQRTGVDIATYRTGFPEAETFTAYAAPDSIPLQGWYLAQDSSRCAVILVHGYGSNRLTMFKYAPLFWNCGCDLLLYDHRAHGASGGQYGTGGYLEAQDLLAVTDWLQQRSGLPDKRIGWFGESWGAATVLQAGAAERELAFIIAESAFQDWQTAVFERAERMYGSWISWLQAGVWQVVSWRTGIDAGEASPLKAAPNITEPVLVLHSRADTETAAEQSDHIAAVLPAGQYRLHNLEWGAMHSNNVIVRPDAYAELVYDFLQDFVPDWGPCSKQLSPGSASAR
jgi:pimeloyl-ACP methyl ester carboxylesterase